MRANDKKYLGYTQSNATRGKAGFTAPAIRES